MFQSGLYPSAFCVLRRHGSAALVLWLMFNAVAAAQDSPPGAASPQLSTPNSIVIPPIASDSPALVRRITLEQAQQLATSATDALARLGQLQVEAAKQKRLGVQSLYFPNVSTQFEGMHFSKPLGELFSVRRPLIGVVESVPVNIIEQDQIAVNVVVAQPITQLFAVRQLVKVARADETIASAKARAPVGDLARAVEENYYALLVAERELAGFGAATRQVRERLVADAIPADTSMRLAAAKVKALTASLTAILGLPDDTRLELIPPAPLVENVTLDEAVAAAAANAAIVEAEQTAVKAHAAERLAKLAYGPGVAVIGGYTHQTAINVVLPENFGYIGVFGTYTLFDSFKRERAVKEAAAEAKAAELGAQLARQKAAASVKTAYFELERSRAAYQLMRQLVSKAQIVETSFVSGDPEGESARARADADMFRAESDYRQAYARLRSLMGQ